MFKEWFDELLQEKFVDSVSRTMGKDIPKNRRYNHRENQITLDKSTSNYVIAISIPFALGLPEYLELPNFVFKYDGVYFRERCATMNDVVYVTYDDFHRIWDNIPIKDKKALLRIFPEDRFTEERNSLLAEEIAKREEAKRVIVDLEINTKLTKQNTEKEFLHLLYMLKYKPQDNQFVWDCYNREYVSFPYVPDYVAHNRAFYTMSNGKYLVISKNPYDFFWASQGNGFESCFSLTSTMRNIRGVPFWICHRNFYMVYVSDGSVKKWGAWDGHKAKVPQMESRFWGYWVNDKLYLGKRYGKVDGMTRDDVIEAFRHGPIAGIDKNRVGDIDTDYDAFRAGRYNTFYDDYNPDDFFVGQNRSSHGDSESFKYKHFKDDIDHINFNPDIQFWPSVMVREGYYRELRLLKHINQPENFYSKIVDEKVARIYGDDAVKEVAICVKIDDIEEIIGSRLFCEAWISQRNPDTAENYLFLYKAGKLYLKRGREDARLVETV